MRERRMRGRLDTLPAGPDGGERSEEILRRPGVRLEAILSEGHISPPDFWYDQDEDEWVAVLQGEGEIEFDDGRRERLLPGE